MEVLRPVEIYKAIFRATRAFDKVSFKKDSYIDNTISNSVS